MNKKNAIMVNAAIIGLFVAGGFSPAHADNHTPSTKKECKAEGGKWKKGACKMDKAEDVSMKDGEHSCKGEGSCKAQGEGSCGEGSCNS